MKLQVRLLLLYTVLFVGAVCLLLLQRSFDIIRSQTILSHELTSHHSYYTKIASTEGGQLDTYSTDYSYWDDMVNFALHPTQTWASENIDSSLSTYGADAAWVYSTKGTLVYYSSIDGNESASHINLPTAAFTELYKNKLEHFYVKEPNGLMEIRAAVIVPSADDKRVTPPQGFWIVGRYLNSDFIAKMADLTQSTVSLDPANANTADRTTSTSVSFGVGLPGWDGKNLAVLTLTSPVTVETDLKNLYNRQLLLLLVFFIASSILVVGSLWWLVLRPVKLLASAISQQKPDLLNDLKNSKTEFGNLAQAVQLSFSQRVIINESEFLKNKLEELNQSKAEFLAIAAHELKGPVGNIYIFSDNLTDQIENAHPDKDQLDSEVKRISQQAHRATVLINDIYQASKGGRALDFVKSEFDFDEFMKRELENNQYSTNQKIVVEGATNQKVVCDPDRLGQIVTNLIRNASKYSPTDQKIFVRLSSVGENVQVEVQDFGVGIDPADQPNIFQRFFRSSRVAKDYPGLGLGLSICKEIAEGLGGKIWFTSELGKGSHFYISLPVSPLSRPNLDAAIIDPSAQADAGIEAQIAQHAYYTDPHENHAAPAAPTADPAPTAAVNHVVEHPDAKPDDHSEPDTATAESSVA